MSQIVCDAKVDVFYLINDTKFLPVFIQVCEIAEKYQDKGLYIGISHHPCGRFTGDYLTNHLPTFCDIKYESEQYLPVITEIAHKERFSRMYLISYCDNYEIISELEKKVLAVGKQEYPNRILNDENSKGGEGRQVNSDLYFLYVCTSI